MNRPPTSSVYPPRATPFVALVAFEYQVTSGDGDAMTLNTWTTGHTAEDAIGEFRRRHRDLGDNEFTADIRSQPQPRNRPDVLDAANRIKMPGERGRPTSG